MAYFHQILMVMLNCNLIVLSLFKTFAIYLSLSVFYTFQRMSDWRNLLMKRRCWSRNEWLYSIFVCRQRILSGANSCVSFTIYKMQIIDIWWAVPCLSRCRITHRRKFWLSQKLFFLLRHRRTLYDILALFRLSWFLFMLFCVCNRLSNIFLLCFCVIFKGFVSILKYYIFALHLLFWLFCSVNIIVFRIGKAWLQNLHTVHSVWLHHKFE